MKLILVSLFVVVSNGRALVDLAPAGRGACDVEKRTNQLRLPCVAMSNDRKVANGFGGVDFHRAKLSFQRSSCFRLSATDTPGFIDEKTDVIAD